MRRTSVILTMFLAILVLGPISYGTAAAGWTDYFESYEPGGLPSPPWYNSGNSAAYVDTRHSVSGGKSLYLYGEVGGCWGALAHREFTLELPLRIEFYVYNGSEALSGCHSIYGIASLNAGSSWETPGRPLIAFDVDDSTGARIIRGCWPSSNDPGGGPNLGNFELETWYKVTIRYDASQYLVRLEYWINDTCKGWYYYPPFLYEQDLSYISLQAGEGSAWFDDVKVYFDPTSAVNPLASANNLADNYPNPFNPTTTIKYSIAEPGHVFLRIYNAAGRLVRTLVDKEQAPRVDGFSIAWDGTNNSGGTAASGVYFYRLTAKNFEQTRKMVVLR